MQERGVEPLHLSVQDPKSCASANSATPAFAAITLAKIKAGPAAGVKLCGANRGQGPISAIETPVYAAGV